MGHADEVPDADPIHVDAGVAFERIALDATSWVDVTRGWLAGAGELTQSLLTSVDWQTSRLFRYDHWVTERRLGSFWRPGRPLPDPAIAPVHRSLQRRYHVQFDGFSLLQYRDGHDGQAFHRDTDMRWLDNTVIAILSLGATRPWLLRPRANRYGGNETWAPPLDLAPGSGDLIVMGGACQAGWEHSVPYLPQTSIGPRISIQWRHAARQGRPFVGAPYGAALTYGKKR
jgi:alkylated DNA repair dioxygenase AlkB